MKMKRVETPGEIEEVRQLFQEYEAYLDADLCFQSFEEELETLPGRYTPPGGVLLLGSITGEVAGSVAVRELTPGVCEMKRLFVRPEFRGSGLGRQLAEEVVALARANGYAKMRLDTLNKLMAANCLYESLGFIKTEPYYDNPLPGVVYWELDLKQVDSTVSSPALPLTAPTPSV